MPSTSKITAFVMGDLSPERFAPAKRKPGSMEAFLPKPHYAAFLGGTFAPDRRASDKPIAIACFRLFTVFPLRPDFNLPRLN